MSNNSVFSNFLWRFAESVCGKLVSVIVSIVLARLIAPSEFGLIALAMVFITIAEVLVQNGFGQSLIQKKDADDTDFSSVFYVNIAFSIALYIVIFFTAPFIAKFYDNELVTKILRALGIIVIIAAFNSIQVAYVSKKMIFKKFFWASFIGTIISGITGIVMAYLGFGIWALVAQRIIDIFLDSLIVFLIIDWRPKLLFSFSKVKELINYGWKLTFQSLATTINGQLRNLLIGKYYTKEDLAYMTRGQQFPSLLISNIALAVTSVLFPALSNINDEKERSHYMLRKASAMLAYVLFPLLSGLMIVAKPLIILLLTEKWIETVPYLQLYCVANLICVEMYSRHEAIKACGRSDIYMWEHLISIVIGLIVLFFTLKHGPFAIVKGGIACSVFLLGLVCFNAKKFNGYGFKEQIIDVLKPIIATIIMVVGIYFIKYIPLSNLALLFVQIIAGIVLYIFLSKIMKIPEYDTVKNILGRYLRRK